MIMRKQKRGSKKGFEMAISTLVVIILGMMVLIALVLAFTGGWKKFWNTIIGFTGDDIDNAKKLCQSQCDLDQKNSFCCEEKLIAKDKTNCLDERLHIDCGINCEGICVKS